MTAMMREYNSNDEGENDEGENEYDSNDDGENERVCERECTREMVRDNCSKPRHINSTRRK